MDSVLLKLLLTSCFASVLAACGNNASNVEAPAGTTVGAGTATNTMAASPFLQPMAVDAYRPPASTASQASPIKPRDLSVAPVPASITLGAPLASQSAAMQKSNESAASAASSEMGKPLKIGFGRPVAQTSTAAATQQVLKWQTTASGGQVAAINFESTGAKGIRLGLLVTQLPETAILRFYAHGATTAFEVKGAEVSAILAKNLAAGDKSDHGRTYWGSLIDGSNGTVEIEIPAGVVSSSVEVSVPKVTHQFISTQEFLTAIPQVTYANGSNAGLTCQVDVRCTTPLPAASDAVVKLVFSLSGGGLATCSGTMLNDSTNSGKPYLLTANHCLSDQTSASSLTTRFKFRSLTCNNSATGEYYPTASNQGSDLKYTAYATDSTLLLLRGTLPTSVIFAGWDSSPPSETSASSVHGIHHPMGDQQRLSRGAVTQYYTRDPNDQYGFPRSNLTNGTIINAPFTIGLVEGGSSGSGLFNGTDANPRLIGQLFGASGGACNGPNGTATPFNNSNFYGRFDVAYRDGMSDSLSPRGYVNRFYNTGTGTHFYTINVAEKAYLQTNFPSFSFEGTPFQAETMQKAGLSPVYRFYNLNLGVHFYTISESERAFVIANLPQMRYEGVAWYSNATSVAGSVPLYRFYNRAKGVHFYTVSTTERDFVIANLPQMNNEGIAYYVLP